VGLGIEAATTSCGRSTTNRTALNRCGACDLHVLAAGLPLSLRVGAAVEPM